MLEMRDVRLQQGDFELRANWAIEAGARVSIIGPSGGGKSTLLDVIGGFLTPSSGQVIMAGQDQRGVTPGERPLSLLFQENNLFPHLSIFDNVALGLDPSLRRARKRRTEIEAALAETGLAGLSLRRPDALSGGQRQRAALARTLLRKRPILALDEPFAALGPALRAEMLELVTSLADRHETTVLMVSHSPEDAKALGGALIFVEDGLAHPPLPMETALGNPTKGLRAYLGQIP